MKLFRKKEKLQDEVTTIKNIERVWMFKLFGEVVVGYKDGNELKTKSFVPLLVERQNKWWRIFFDVAERKDSYVTITRPQPYFNNCDYLVCSVDVHLASIDDFEMC